MTLPVKKEHKRRINPRSILKQKSFDCKTTLRVNSFPSNSKSKQSNNCSYEMIQKICNGQYIFHDAHWKDFDVRVKELIGKLLNIYPEERLTALQTVEYPYIHRISMNQKFRGAVTAIIFLNRLSYNRLKSNSKQKMRKVIQAILAVNKFQLKLPVLRRRSLPFDHCEEKSTKYKNNAAEDLHKIDNDSNLARVRSRRDSLKFVGMPGYQCVSLKRG